MGRCMKRLTSSMFTFFVLTTAQHAGAQEAEPSPGRSALAVSRIELRPYGGWATAAHSVSGAFVGGDLAFRPNRFFALGADVAWYGPFNGSGGARPSYPLNETRWSADLDAYVFALPARRPGATAFEPYVLTGLGLLASRPISVVDPTVRQFSDGTLIDLAVGVGVHFFFVERVAITLEIRDLVYFDKVEASSVASPPSDRSDPDTWYAPSSQLTNAVQVRLGAAFFVL